MNTLPHPIPPGLASRIDARIRGVDVTLLVLLLLVCNQAVIALKLAGLLLVFILRPDLRLGLLKGRLPLAYLLLPALGLLNLLLRVQDFSGAYLTAISLATGYWLAALFCSHQLRLCIERRGAEVVHRTLRIFSFLNLIASLWQLARICMITGTLNPYVGLDFPYGMSTGDNIYGAFMQLSYCNMMVSTMLCIYFLFRRDLWAAVASCTSLLLVFGNVGNLVFALIVLILFGLFLLRSRLPEWMRRFAPERGAGAAFIGIALLFALFYGVVSRANLTYTEKMLTERVESVAAEETPAQAQEEAIEEDQFKALRFDQYGQRPYVRDSADYERRVALTRLALSEFGGKRLAFRETKAYLLQNTSNLLLGAGPVRFSSLTAQRMSGLDSSRLFSRVLPRFTAPEFHDNHRLLSLERVTAPSAQFSNSNWPDSFYNQLLGEYGLLGTIVFTLFYVWFFLRRWTRLSFGVWIAAALIPFALLSYLFEPLCVVLFFELLMYLDIELQSRKQSSLRHA